MAYKMIVNGTEITADTIAELQALQALMGGARMQPPQLPAAKKNGSKVTELELPPLKKIKGARVQPLASLDAARAIELAFGERGKPISPAVAKHYTTVPGDVDTIKSRLGDACRRGLIKRVVLGLYVPMDYEPTDALEGLREQTIKALPAMAMPVVKYLIDRPQDWKRSELVLALAEHLKTTPAAANLRIWGATRLGWIGGDLGVTQAGLDAAAKGK